MEAKLVTELPKDAGWQFEPKWDGFRCLAFRAGGDGRDQGQVRQIAVALFSRRCWPICGRSRPKTFVLDGELVIPVDGALSFDALQMRLHPAASRIERLAKETPATFIVFDCLLAQGAPVALARAV